MSHSDRASARPAAQAADLDRSGLPLSGIRVLDFTRVMSGPFCTALLADLGAEVIKVEPPSGDDYRHIGPFKDGESGLFLLMNRGKKSITIDMKQPAGRQLALDLAAKSDVLVENFKPGVAERLGIGFEAVKAVRGDIVYASISGFGQTGPGAERPAYDLVVQAMSGLMAATGEEGGQPLKVGESFGDLIAGLYASWAILAALTRRERTGLGENIDIAMFDTLFSMLPTSLAQLLTGGRIPIRVGNRHPLSTPFGAFRARDGQVVIAVLNGPQFTRFAEVIGTPDMAADPRFCSDEQRTQHEPDLRAIIEAWTSQREIADIEQRLLAAGIAAAPIFNIAEAANSDQAVDRKLLRQMPHAKLGSSTVIAQPVRFASADCQSAHAAPMQGADGAQILRDVLGLDAAGIARCLEMGAIVEGGAQ